VAGRGTDAAEVQALAEPTGNADQFSDIQPTISPEKRPFFRTDASASREIPERTISGPKNRFW